MNNTHIAFFFYFNSSNVSIANFGTYDSEGAINFLFSFLLLKYSLNSVAFVQPPKPWMEL